MNLGCCISTLADVPALDAAGADYYEVPIARLRIGDLSDDAFAGLIAQVNEFRLRPRAYNVLLPPHLAVTGHASDPAAIAAYAQTVFGRVRRLGGGLVVFGSGRSRSIPEAFGRAPGFEQFADALRSMAALAAGTGRPASRDNEIGAGVVLVLEPLRQSETNVINTLREGAAFLRRHEITGVGLLADLYHMMEEAEPYAALDECAGLLAHVHLADTGRRPPGQGAYDLIGFLRRLRDAGYRGDCSIECGWADFPSEIRPSLEYVRETAQMAGWL